MIKKHAHSTLIIIYKFLIIIVAINVPMNNQKAPSSFPIFSLGSYFLKKNKVPMAIKIPLIIQVDNPIIRFYKDLILFCSLIILNHYRGCVGELYYIISLYR